MPEFPLAALNAETAWLNTNGQPLTVSVDGTFVGTVRLFYRTGPSGTAAPISTGFGGGFAEFTVPSGALFIEVPETERGAQVQARMVAYTSGTAAVRLGNS